MLIVWLSPNNILPIGFSPTGSVVIIFLIWITTFLIPTLSLFILKISGSISSLSLNDRKERITPLIYTTIMYGVTAYLFSTKVELGTMISIYLGIAALLIGLTGLITLIWKISAHTMGVGGLIGLISGVNRVTSIDHFAYVLAVLFLIAGLVGSARLKLNAHSQAQIYTGFLLGVCVSFVSYVVYVI